MTNTQTIIDRYTPPPTNANLNLRSGLNLAEKIKLVAEYGGELVSQDLSQERASKRMANISLRIQKEGFKEVVECIVTGNGNNSRTVIRQIQD